MRPLLGSLAFVLLALAGCGQKGPLTLPAPSPAAPATPAASAPGAR